MCLKFLITSISVIKSQKTRNRENQEKKGPNRIEGQRHHHHHPFLYPFAQQTVIADMAPGTEKDDQINEAPAARRVSCWAWCCACVCTPAYSPKRAVVDATEVMQEMQRGKSNQAWVSRGRCHLR